MIYIYIYICVSDINDAHLIIINSVSVSYKKALYRSQSHFQNHYLYACINLFSFSKAIIHSHYKKHKCNILSKSRNPVKQQLERRFS